jgi:chromodomain-helicase-DNA-binding protein 7
MLCNYETVVQEPDLLLSVRWQYLIVDEGHRLKNRHSRSLEVMSALRAKRKLVLTGTPLQNHVAELWSILSFLDGHKFNDVDAFLERFGKLSTGGGTSDHVNQLNKLLKPHLLRREKDDVENSIPGMKETLLYVEITNLQKMCYRAVLERNRELLLRGAGTGAGGVASTFNNISMMLRHCCNHPWLIQEVEDGARP